MTVYVRDEEWFEVGNWVYQNWEIINGVSFLPYDGGHYELAPYEEIDEHTYKRLKKKMPKINYNNLSKYEKEDHTQGKGEYACTGDKCDI
jgi:ribonucleoside-diphosphate reductase alpha chain